jgi:cysteine sulfinate desulfinase/cysteine desulfurase-like protein/rhodanese-related sulfurtransferase
MNESLSTANHSGMDVKRPRFLVQSNIYFDCNATTPSCDQAQKAAIECMELCFGNPSSSHLNGVQAKFLMESVRQKLAQVLNVSSTGICFTSGATEAIQLAVFSSILHLKERVKGLLESSPGNSSEKFLLLYGATEHKAVPESLNHWNQILGSPFEVKAIPVDVQGQLRFDFLEKYLSRCVFIATMAVNNETGVIHDLPKVSQMLNKQDVRPLWLVDSVQALGKIHIDFVCLGVDYASFSGHKLYAPKGTGFLYASPTAPITPLIVGGGQESGKRSGTENLPGVAAIGAVIDAFTQHQFPFQCTNTMRQYQRQIAKTLEENFPQTKWNSPWENGVPTCLNFSLPGLSSGEIIDLFDTAGLSVSATSACSAQKPTYSFVLQAMGLPEEQVSSACRLSFGPATTRAEIEAGCKAIELAKRALDFQCWLPSPPSHYKETRPSDGWILFQFGLLQSWVWVDKKSQSAYWFAPKAPLVDRVMYFLNCQKISLAGVYLEHHLANLDSLLASRLEKSPSQVIPMAQGQWCTYLPSDHSTTPRPINVLTHSIDGFELLTSSPDETQYYIWNGKPPSSWQPKANPNAYYLCLTEPKSPVTSQTCKNGPGKNTGNPFEDSFPCLFRVTSPCTPFAPPLFQDLQLEAHRIPGLFSSFSQIHFIDVRESFEFDFFRDRLSQTPWQHLLENIPSSQLVSFLAREAAKSENSNKLYLFLCRGGMRSAKAALQLRSLGLPHAYSIAYGISGLLSGHYKESVCPCPSI